MEIAAVSPEIRRLRERVIRLRAAPFIVFMARLRRRRKGRRWEMEEVISPLNPADKLNLKELRALVEDRTHRWAPAGTYAEVMGTAWRASLIVGEGLPYAEQYLGTLQALVGERSQKAGLTPAHETITWLYPETKKGVIRLSWVFSRSTAIDDPAVRSFVEGVLGPQRVRQAAERQAAQLPPAVYLSAVLGRFSGRLRLCRFCQEPFLADYRWGRACKHCQRARAIARRPNVRRVLDRVRKRHQGTALRKDALDELRVLPLPDWMDRWDKKDPSGRGAPIRRR